MKANGSAKGAVAIGVAALAVISGNHDNARRLEAVAPVLEAVGDVHVLTKVARPDAGGVRRFTTRAGEDVVLAMLPFVSKRGIVRDQAMWVQRPRTQASAVGPRGRCAPSPSRLGRVSQRGATFDGQECLCNKRKGRGPM